MSTSFTKIYERTLSQYIDDFALKKYNGSIIAMNQDLQSYLLSAIPEFNTPISIIGKIQDYTEAEGKTEQFVGDGEKTSFVISTDPIDNSIIEVSIDSMVLSDGYSYDEENKQSDVRLLTSAKQAKEDCLINGELLVTAHFNSQQGRILSIHCFYYEGGLLYFCTNSHIYH